MRGRAYAITALLLSSLTPLGASPVMAQNDVEHGDIFTGNRFLTGCSDYMTSPRYFLSGLCLGYLRGINDMNEPAYYCLPTGWSYEQLMDTVLAYLRGNPDKRHHHAGVLIMIALKNAFPCPAKPMP